MTPKRTACRLIPVFCSLMFATVAAPREKLEGEAAIVIRNAVKEKRIPGAVLAVRRHGRLIAEEAAGYAVLETGRKMRVDDIFMIASSSKPIAATAILTLVDSGLLKLDEPVRKFFPGFAGPSTIRQLLSHTSGIFGNNGPPEQVQWIRNFDRSLADSVEGIVRVPLAYPPGTRYVYTGAGMSVAGRIAEMLTGMEFDSYMEKAITRPLGLTDTFYRTSKDISARVPQIYRKTDEGFTPVPAIMEAPGRRGPRSSGFLLVPGGIYSTARDLLRFLEVHLKEGSAHGKRILSRELTFEMRRKQTGTLTEEYGLGWALEDHSRRFGHGGAYGTYIWVDPERDLVGVILTQQQSPETQRFIQEVKAAVERDADSRR